MEDDKHHEYGKAIAGVIASCIHEIKVRVVRNGISFIQQFSLRKGSKEFGEKVAMQSMTKEVEQLHKRNSFKPISISEFTDEEKRMAQDAIMLLA